MAAYEVGLKGRQQLIHQVKHTDAVINYLRHRNVLSVAQERMIKARGSPPSQMTGLLETVYLNLSKLRDALIHTGQVQLANKCLPMTNLGIDAAHKNCDEVDADVFHSNGRRSLPAFETKVSSIKQKQNLHLQSTAEMKPHNKLLLTDKQHIQAQLSTIIEDKNADQLKFVELLRKIEYRQFTPSTGMKNGLTILHQIVVNNRVSYLEVIMDRGFWSILRDIRSAGGPEEIRNLTAVEMAQRLGFEEIWGEINRLNHEEKSLNEWHKEIRINNVKGIEKLLSGNKSEFMLNKPSLYGKTPLYWATTAGNLEIIEKLTKEGADPFCVTENGDTLITRAMSLSHSHLVRYLVVNLKLDPRQAGIHKKFPVCLAAEIGRIDIFKTLLNVGADIESKDMKSMVLAAAAIHGKIDFLKFLTEEYHLNPDLKDSFGRTALLFVLKSGQLESAENLIQKGADVMAKDRQNRNILHFAIEGKSLAALKFAIDICRVKGTLFQTILNAKDIFTGSDLVRLVKGKYHGQQGWHYVEVKRNLFSIFHEKIQGGPIDVSSYSHLLIKSGWGESPGPEIIKYMEQKYSILNIPDSAPADLTPLMLAVMLDHSSAVEILLKEKPALDITDCFGMTAAGLACMKGNMNILQMLVKAGSDLQSKDKEGHSLSNLATLNGHVAIAKYLEECECMAKIEKFVQSKMSRALRGLNSHTLEERFDLQNNMAAYGVSVLRDLSADINEILYDIGTSPIGQPTDYDEEDEDV